MVSSKILGAVILCLLLGFGVGYGTHALMAPTTPTTPTATQQTQLIKIGGVYELSGSDSFLGSKEQHAAQLAVDEVNRNLAAGGSNIQFQLVVQDSQSSPAAAKAAYQTLVASGIQLITGYALSADLKEVIPLAAQDKVVVIASSSTSPALAIDKPFVYRMAGTDKDGGRGLASIVASQGYKNAVIVYREDAWGDSLAHIAAEHFANVTGGQTQLIGYPATGYVMGGICGTVSDAVSKFGLNNTAVIGITFEDDGIALATASSSYPVLSSVKWVMAQSLTGSSAVLANPTAVTFFEHVKLLETSFAYNQQNPAFIAFKNAATAAGYEDALIGEAPYSYDAAMLGMQAVLVAGNNGTAINSVLPSLATHYNGVTGVKSLDQFHDQLYQDWFITRFETLNGQTNWYQVGFWTASTDTITWFSTPQTIS